MTEVWTCKNTTLVNFITLKLYICVDYIVISEAIACSVFLLDCITFLIDVDSLFRNTYTHYISFIFIANSSLS